MNIALAVFLFIHGFAHIVGFLVYWKLMKDKEVTYKTTIYPGNINIGDSGVRLLGIVYLAVALSFGLLGYDLISQPFVLSKYIWAVVVVSLVLCITGWPDTKFGVVANLILIVFLILNTYVHWIL
ncbi:MAG: hypothetical protein DRI88_01425 [Bacteroidetes bacterium]|nr:MAG: hypothetical protein DRI88_01425 [Bacteroidota bacterium]RLD73479.1 MAG: hypothetical protein DRI87_03855 [Bacteroidota bacterium]RLD89113.1 MAG: hypothetical protein DRJ02_02245 [Bacteroidota bacterium]